MSAILEVRKLCKEYPQFRLEDVSFRVEAGKIMGFIGRNGAGKTTTMKCLLNLVHPRSGEISYFGKGFRENEDEIKQRIGYAAGGVNYYQRKKLREIVAVTRMFYDNWDEEQYRCYMEYFSLDENKSPSELSEGMKVKFNLAVALSHRAELLLLDEPTSGLDPVSRDDLLEVFMELAGRGVAILFSTHITSDLEKCADEITYIKKGKILASKGLDEFIGDYRILKVEDAFRQEQRALFLGTCRNREGDTALIPASQAEMFPDAEWIKTDLQSIMSHIEKMDREESEQL